MDNNLKFRLNRLRDEYEKLVGYPFTYFYCPILFKDEDVPLCKGHIINLAFPNSARDWTVQRQDIDNFFGANFESDFVDILYNENRQLANTVTDKNLFRKLEPKISVDDRRVDFFVTRGAVPDHFTSAVFNNEGKEVHLTLKMNREDIIAALGGQWAISIQKDIRVPAMVSLIKSAHLTLFDLLGYNYALSAGGYFVGRQVLGEFFLQNKGKQKSEVTQNALPFFREFAHMVRPVKSEGHGLQGTITDKIVLICKDAGGPPWAFIVFIRVSQSLHSVMIPILEDPNAGAKFITFLQDKSEFIEANYARFEQDHWGLNEESVKLQWPKTGVLYP
jgi:hypothetical protein